MIIEPFGIRHDFDFFKEKSIDKNSPGCGFHITKGANVLFECRENPCNCIDSFRSAMYNGKLDDSAEEEKINYIVKRMRNFLSYPPDKNVIKYSPHLFRNIGFMSINKSWFIESLKLIAVTIGYNHDNHFIEYMPVDHFVKFFLKFKKIFDMSIYIDGAVINLLNELILVNDGAHNNIFENIINLRIYGRNIPSTIQTLFSSLEVLDICETLRFSPKDNTCDFCPNNECFAESASCDDNEITSSQPSCIFRKPLNKQFFSDVKILIIVTKKPFHHQWFEDMHSLQYLNVKINGKTMPNLSKLSNAVIVKLGFTFDSSISSDMVNEHLSKLPLLKDLTIISPYEYEDKKYTGFPELEYYKYIYSSGMYQTVVNSIHTICIVNGDLNHRPSIFYPDAPAFDIDGIRARINSYING